MVGGAPLALWPSVGDLSAPRDSADQECGWISRSSYRLSSFSERPPSSIVFVFCTLEGTPPIQLSEKKEPSLFIRLSFQPHTRCHFEHRTRCPSPRTVSHTRCHSPPHQESVILSEVVCVYANHAVEGPAGSCSQRAANDRVPHPSQPHRDGWE